MPRPTRPRIVLPAVLVVIATCLFVAPAVATASPLQTTALWLAHPPSTSTPQQVAAAADQAGIHTLFVKAAEGSTPEPGYTAALVSSLTSRGITVCAWTFVYGQHPAAEAAAAEAAVAAGAKCLVIDAEEHYDSRYGAAQAFVRALRRKLGAGFPIGLAGEALIAVHPKFPYSVFLGPGGFSVDMPQVYWRDFNMTPSVAFAAAIPANMLYGRPIAPVGQLFGGVTSEEVGSFLTEARIWSPISGFSLFDFEEAQPAELAMLLARPIPAIARTSNFPVVSPGADGDEIVWAQEHLNGAGARLPVGGFYGAQTARAIARFQTRRRLKADGILGPSTWRALLKVRPRIPSWAKAPPQSAR
jgi:Putative peptidoglycan binding domain